MPGLGKAGDSARHRRFPDQRNSLDLVQLPWSARARIGVCGSGTGDRIANDDYGNLFDFPVYKGVVF